MYIGNSSLQIFAVSQVENVCNKDIGIIPCVDVDAVGGNSNLEKVISVPPLGTVEQKFDVKEKDSELEAGAAHQSNSICHEDDTGSKSDIQNYEGSVEPDTRDTSVVMQLQEMNHIEMAPSGSPSSVL